MASTDSTKQNPLQRITASEFANRLSYDIDAQDKRYAFFLGSGCSVSSGIKTAGGLVEDVWLPRLRDLVAPDQIDIRTWAKIELNYDAKSPASSYGILMKRLFLQREEQQREIEDLCGDKFPSFGYSVLAALMARTNTTGKFNVVLTTNFDDLVADALYLFTAIRPLVIHHESLAGYIRPTRTRPLIIKLHGDNHLSPYNTPEQTANLPKKTNQQVRNLLHDRGLIFLGYSGNDKSIKRLLKELPEDALPLGIYWCSSKEPSCQLSKWLRKRDAIWVESPPFDEFMLLVHAAMSLELPKPKRFEDVFNKLMETYKKLTGDIEKAPATTVEQAALKAAVVKTDKSFPEWRAVVLEAYRLENTNPEAAEVIYKDGVKRFPKSAKMLIDYADFLHKQNRPQEAEEYYKRAVVADPSDADCLNNYAVFLTEEKRINEAEEYFKAAIKADPANISNLSDYATFLSQQQRILEAEEYYKRAIEVDSTNSFVLGNYAVLLSEQGQQEEAEIYYKRAIKADRKGANNMSNYAVFLKKHGRLQEAEDYYKRAIKADPTHVSSLFKYAGFLREQQKPQEAETYYLRAIASSPISASALSSYAVFLNEEGRIQDAENYSQRAVEAAPKDANILANYAQILLAKNGSDELASLDRAQKAIGPDSQSDLLLELSFYDFVHRPPLGNISPLKNISKLLVAGDRSKGWNLLPNVARAQKDGHPFTEWLPKLAAVIADEAPLNTLNDWPEWQQIEA